jgi:peptide/nickel transport system permease protein
MGTDAHGRDLFARLVHGTRTALGLALLAVVIYVAVGSFLGALSGFFGGALDFVVERTTEALSSFPVLVLVLVVQALLTHPTATSLLLAIAAVRWTEVARLVRADVLVASQQDFAMAARALGASPARVLYKHVLPQAIGPVIVAGALGLGQMVLVESSLDFLRAGLPEPVPSWGESLAESRYYLSAWWLLVFPALLVLAAVVSSNVVGEALRDALDPRFSPTFAGQAPLASPASRRSRPSR